MYPELSIVVPSLGLSQQCHLMLPGCVIKIISFSNNGPANC